MIRPASSGASAKAVMLVASRRTGRTIRIWSVMKTSPAATAAMMSEETARRRA